MSHDVAGRRRSCLEGAAMSHDVAGRCGSCLEGATTPHDVAGGRGCCRAPRKLSRRCRDVAG
eukprot:82203-Chlamydomonas_euryale.AAC.1